MIDANTTLKAIDKAISDYTEHDDILRLYSDLRLSVLDAKTVEAEPIRHGHWLHMQGGVFYPYRCNLCGDRASEQYPYCHCGAKMDEKENEDDRET